MDGDLGQADPNEAIGKIVRHLRRVRPQVVFTFDQVGAYGHADHVAICQFTTTATVAAADPTYLPDHGAPHAISKLYYFCWSEPEWAITTRIDTRKWWPQVWRAISCHAS